MGLSEKIKARRREKRAEIRAEARRIANERGCANCGSKDNLQWHHIESRDGKHHRTVAQSKTWPSLYSEIEKCVVLCVKCHVRHHKVKHETCTIANCNRDHYGKGMCFLHYQREYRKKTA